MASKLVQFILMGPPGSGKGTVATRIVKKFGPAHLSSGDLLRSQMQAKTKAGLAAKEYVDQGQLVPDDIMIDLVQNELNRTRNQSWLLDGFPRTTGQADNLMKRERIDFVVNLNVPFETIIDRIKGRLVHLPSGRVYNTEFNPPKKHGTDDVTGEPLIQRDDDKPQTVLKRLKAYENQTKPLLRFYSKLSILHEFSGTETNKIWPHVELFLKSRYS